MMFSVTGFRVFAATVVAVLLAIILLVRVMAVSVPVALWRFVVHCELSSNALLSNRLSRVRLLSMPGYCLCLDARF